MSQLTDAHTHDSNDCYSLRVLLLRLVNSERRWNSTAHFRYRGSIECRDTRDGIVNAAPISGSEQHYSSEEIVDNQVHSGMHLARFHSFRLCAGQLRCQQRLSARLPLSVLLLTSLHHGFSDLSTTTDYKHHSSLSVFGESQI